jgi:nucleotide-binding universal stress UspA family protein
MEKTVPHRLKKITLCRALLMGSVAERVIGLAPCPVLVVKKK